MSDELPDLYSLIDLLSPLHEAQARGLSPKTIERIYRCLIAVDDRIDELEAQLEGAEAELEAIETERAEAGVAGPRKAAAMTVAWRPTRRSALSARDSAELYETPSCALRSLIETGELDRFARSCLWECAAGRGAIARVLKAAGFRVHATDLIDYDGADAGILTPVDFLLERKAPAGVSALVTNPPFDKSDRFIRHGLSLGLTVIVLLRWQAAEGEKRSDIIDGHLRRVWLGRQRLPMMHRQNWDGPRTKSGGSPFAWYVFEPGMRGLPYFEVRRITWWAPC